jgi:hypothetical protein
MFLFELEFFIIIRSLHINLCFYYRTRAIKLKLIIKIRVLLKFCYQKKKNSIELCIIYNF